jgi:hypothetical protein
MARRDALRRTVTVDARLAGVLRRARNRRLAQDRDSGRATPNSARIAPARVESVDLPGTPVDEEQLSTLGFAPLELVAVDPAFDLGGTLGCAWTTAGEVPEGPGLYAFTVEDSEGMRLCYLGMTSHLWMVTKGRLPRGGGSRPGQRYGRPTYAGATRQRINVAIGEQLRAGRRVRHWVRPVALALEADVAAALRELEEELIVRFHLRQRGWNRK